MPVGDTENDLPDTELVRSLGFYASAWWDMRHAAQIIEARTALPEGLAGHFPRRGLIDGAVITYGRCFKPDPRGIDLRPLAETMLTADEVEVHKVVLRWRDKHTGHRVDPKLETISARLLWGDWGRDAATIRVRLVTAYMPDLPDFEQRFENLALRMSILIWEARIYPLQQSILSELGDDKLQAMKLTARPYHEQDWPGPRIGAHINVGSNPPD
jgi:hypothetical protein